MVAVSPQIFQPLTQNIRIVPGDAELGHREAVKEKHACTTGAEGREKSEGRVAGERGKDQFLDDMLTNPVMVLSSRAMQAQLTARDNDIPGAHSRVDWALPVHCFDLYPLQRNLIEG